MEFLTLHELSRELNKPERQLRHKFKNLLKKNILIEGEDFIREGFIDDQHFVFKINPLRFAELTQLNPSPLPDTSGYKVDNKFDNNGYQADTNSVNNMVTNAPEVDTKGGTQQETIHKPDMQQSADAPLSQKFIDHLISQITEKDKQLAEKDSQLKSKDELLKQAQEQTKEKDNAQILALSEIIRLNKKLLPSSQGESVRNVDPNGYQSGNPMDTNSGNQASDVDNNFVNN